MKTLVLWTTVSSLVPIPSWLLIWVRILAFVMGWALGSRLGLDLWTSFLVSAALRLGLD